MDCHGAGKEWSFNSLVPDLLDPDCEYVVQDNWTEYTEFLEKGCDAALLVGMHARAGTRPGVLNHTVVGRDYQNLRFNGTLVGEVGIHAALCGTWGCPVLLVTGDEAVCNEGRELLGNGLTTVAVKTRRSAPPPRARSRRSARGELIEEGAREALADLKAVPPWDPGGRARSRSSSRTRTRPTCCASGPASTASTTARSPSPRHLVGGLEGLLLLA